VNLNFIVFWCSLNGLHYLSLPYIYIHIYIYPCTCICCHLMEKAITEDGLKCFQRTECRPVKCWFSRVACFCLIKKTGDINKILSIATRGYANLRWSQKKEELTVWLMCSQLYSTNHAKKMPVEGMHWMNTVLIKRWKSLCRWAAITE